MQIAHSDTSIAHKIAGHLLEIEAVKLNLEQPFVWASGWNSPIYCDNRLTLSYPSIRTVIKEALGDAIGQHFGGLEAVAGVATAGIPQGALVADHLNLPFLYVRSKPKGHGLENLIEGKVNPGQKVVVLEDLISTGGSSLKAVDALRQAQVDVIGMISIFTYGFDVAADNFQEAQVPYLSLCDYHQLIDFAAQQGIVNKGQIESLQAWRADPANWSI